MKPAKDLVDFSFRMMLEIEKQAMPCWLSIT